VPSVITPFAKSAAHSTGQSRYPGRTTTSLVT